MTGHSPESNAGRIPENVDEEEATGRDGDDGFRDTLTERTIEVDNTDEDEMEETGNNGYEPIPTSAEGPDDNEEQEDDEIEFGYTTFDGEEFQVRTARDYHQLLDETTPRTTMDEAAAATTRPSAESIPLDPTQIENIKSIMSNITLPTEGIPNWANTVSDDQLKQVVENKLGNKKPEDDWAVFE